MEKEFIEKIQLLSFYSSTVGDCDGNKLAGVAEGVLSFKRDKIIEICEELFLFTLYGLAKSGQSSEIVDFLEEYANGKFQYKKGTTSTIRFIHFANYYMNKFKKDFEKTQFEIGNIFLGFQKR